ncbi:thiamine pyrophosphate-dependent enzyme [Pseudarthrobacter sp. N5]|uniref:thiamine pyrophosphate-dependent enzyme n=1 Tax=Pseudarthrobacter sp. N5 TaxID=3418416 RepID=UPI003CFB2C94
MIPRAGHQGMRSTVRDWREICLPDRPVVAFAGDGAMQMNGLAELITIQRYGQEWADPRLVVAFLHNNDLNHVIWELRAMGGAPTFTESQSLPDVDYAAFASNLGLESITSPSPHGARAGTQHRQGPRQRRQQHLGHHQRRHQDQGRGNPAGQGKVGTQRAHFPGTRTLWGCRDYLVVSPMRVSVTVPLPKGLSPR